jgi:hypothetical protein
MKRAFVRFAGIFVKICTLTPISILAELRHGPADGDPAAMRREARRPHTVPDGHGRLADP